MGACEFTAFTLGQGTQHAAGVYFLGFMGGIVTVGIPHSTGTGRTLYSVSQVAVGRSLGGLGLSPSPRNTWLLADRIRGTAGFCAEFSPNLKPPACRFVEKKMQEPCFDLFAGGVEWHWLGPSFRLIGMSLAFVGKW